MLKLPEIIAKSRKLKYNHSIILIIRIIRYLNLLMDFGRLWDYNNINTCSEIKLSNWNVQRACKIYLKQFAAYFNEKRFFVFVSGDINTATDFLFCTSDF